MLSWKRRSSADSGPVLDALSRSLAIIEFNPQGQILSANENFCRALGYELSDIVGQHHRLFVDPEESRKPAYAEFWAKLARGDYDAREYKRLGKGGREVWIQASYNPVRDNRGKVVKVVKVATVITDQKLKAAEAEGKLAALSLVQAVIEFTTAGEVITANDNTLAVLGYRLDEIQGRHHRMFVEPGYGLSEDYKEFWLKLNRGEYISASFKRVGKNGKEIWISASYNPIVDMNGKILKIVKFATDITDLTQIGAGLSRLADNDLNDPITKPFGASFEKLRTDFNTAHDSLRSTLLQIVESAQVITSGSREIAGASDDLAHRTEQQAASLEQTAAALDEITATVKRSAEGAHHARQVVAAADDDAQKSTVVMQEAVKAMDAIAKSAHQIGQIIGVIDEIAFQTNLLALNAGVEAARAGEAGKGFAVVASEVRALAQRSAEAAKEIKALISSSSTQVEQGVALVSETGRSLSRIREQVAEINQAVADIAAGAKEQSVGLDEVNTAVNQMDKVTQQNAAMVEQSTAVSHSLSQEAAGLSALIGRFKLGQNAEDPLRQQLRAVAPHAFGKQPAAAGPVPSATRTPVKAKNPVVPRGMRSGRTAVAAETEDWEEF